MRVAAVQLELALADVPANLAACESLARGAARAGAEAIALPEFFTTGAAFVPELAGATLAPDGAATEMLLRQPGGECPDRRVVPMPGQRCRGPQ